MSAAFLPLQTDQFRALRVVRLRANEEEQVAKEVAERLGETAKRHGALGIEVKVEVRILVFQEPQAEPAPEAEVQS